MKYTLEQLQDFNIIKTITNDEVKILFDELKEMINNEKDLTKCSKYYSNITLVILYNNYNNLLKDMITFGETCLNLSLTDRQKGNFYYGLVNLYHKYTYAPKIVEYGLLFINCQFERNVLNDITVYNLLAIVLKKTGFYDEAYKYLQLWYQKINKVTKIDKNYLSLIYLNNCCYILIKLGQYDKALANVKEINQIIENNKDNPLISGLIPVFNFTNLYMNLFACNDLDVISEYLKVMDDIMHNLVINDNTKQSLEAHVEFIKKMIEKGYKTKAVEIISFILNSKVFVGDYCELYRILINLYKQDNSIMSISQYENILNRYLEELELLEESHNSILTLLIKEQFRIDQINNTYEQRELRYQTDVLTNCLNRPSLEMNGQDLINQYGQGIIFFIDIDNLKKTNDTYGHVSGDLVLKEFANRVKEVNRMTDCNLNFYRYLGDEFLILSDITEERLNGYLDKLEEAFKEPFNNNDNLITIEFSIGYCLFDNSNNNLNELINKADEAMYKCKKNHKNIRK